MEVQIEEAERGVHGQPLPAPLVCLVQHGFTLRLRFPHRLALVPVPSL